MIKTIEKVRERCSQPELLLDYIIAEKITGQAEKGMRYTNIGRYAQLYSALRTNLINTGSVSALRSRLESCRQGPMETVPKFNNRYRQITNELKYAIQGEHTNILEGTISIQIEKKESLKRYMLNLKREIVLQVKAQKYIIIYNIT